MKKALYIFLLAIPLLACTLTNRATLHTETGVPTPAQVTQTATPAQLTCTVTAFEALNLRESPGTSAAVLTTLKAGEIVTLLPRPAQGNRIPVKAGGREGYVNKNYCESEEMK